MSNPEYDNMAVMDGKDYNAAMVKEARIKAGFKNQTDVGSKMGCSRKLVSECETGYYVSFEWLQRFAFEYGVLVKDWLYDQRQSQSNDEKILE